MSSWWYYLATTSSAFLSTTASFTFFATASSASFLSTSSSASFFSTSSSLFLLHSAVTASSVLVAMSLITNTTIESRALMRDSLSLGSDRVATTFSLNKMTWSGHPAKCATNSFHSVFVFHHRVLALDILDDFSSCCAVFSGALPTSPDGIRDKNIVRFLPRTERWNQRLISDSLPSIVDQLFIVLLHGDINFILGVVNCIIFVHQFISCIQANDRVSWLATCLLRGVSSKNSGFLLLLQRKIAQVRRPLSDLGYFHDKDKDKTGLNYKDKDR